MENYRLRKDEVWNKASVITHANPDLYRKDKCGNVIYYHSYGKDTKMGWNIDHSKPQHHGGTNHLNNLQALQTAQNKSKGSQMNYNYQQGTERKGISVRAFNSK